MPYDPDASLFQRGDFTSHAGLPLKWKLECDAITDEEWRCLAKMIMDYQDRPFSKAVGIPRGGVKLAEALNEYASGDDTDFPLICDDVFTTGTSMVDFIKEKFEATKINDTAALSNIEKNEANLIKRKYYYTTNFSIQNATPCIVTG